MKYFRKCCVPLFLVATIAAISLRLPLLEQRPMHGDEAVHAVKFGELLEKGSYRYNPDEYHGPTLNYLTLIPARLSSARKLSDLSEFTLRIVPVFFGVCLVLLLWLLTDGLGRPAVVCAAVLTAVSPAFVFYSRYYIQEMLLVCFTFGAITFGYRYTQNKSIKWALLTALSLGLMHATKETSIIAFGSMLLAVLIMLLMQRRQDGSVLSIKEIVKPRHAVAALITAAIVSALFYSSFFTNPTGILDSIRTYSTYFSRAGRNGLHNHPWYYYLKMLIYFKVAAGPVWSEALIVILAVVGFIVAVTRKGIAGVNFALLRFIAFYTLIMTVLYSVIPYKTPW
ncbi:MAG TPA: TIGR03663 family protein, partial [Phycisphaerales bacterium]|nr:TIGR03663 family protein [Phycisphaerales bacterium]